MFKDPKDLARIALGAALLAAPGLGQSFALNGTDIPTGGAKNSSTTENVDFGDVDGDGDMDALFADGGEDGNDRNRIWINMGGLQGGTQGVFDDQTAARIPAGQDASRDIEFVDIDGDGDLDIYTSNTSTLANQSNKWLVNQGGLQAGTEGYYVDETATRWVNLGVNSGGSGSSIASSFVFPGGTGFIDFSCDCDFADIDNDGDLDLAHGSYGGVLGGATPTRFFLNDGLGNFEEYNPSGFQLLGGDIGNGQPAIWAEGTQQANTAAVDGSEADVAGTTFDVELADNDLDWDIDLLMGGRNEPPRLFHNRMEDTGGGALVPFRDVSNQVFPAGWAPGQKHYEQEWGDLDGDDDLDLYGVNWDGDTSLEDVTLENDGAGVYLNRTLVSGSGHEDIEADFIDYDQDGDLDIFVTALATDSRLLRNDGPAGSYSFTDVTLTELPVVAMPALDADGCDVDGDGDMDLFVAREQMTPNLYVENITQVADTTAPRIPRVEQVADRAASAATTVVRAHVLDNGPYYATWYNATTLEYSTDGGVFCSVAMVSSGGQMTFRGEIPGEVVGAVTYRVRSIDATGNVGLSSTRSFTASGACTGVVKAYCTAGTTASGCNAVLSATGVASATASSGFTVSAATVEGSKDGIFFYGFSGAQANSWGSGTSFQCVVPPVIRSGILSGVGTQNACDGSFSKDMNAYLTGANPSKVPASGQLVSIQLWFRDPQNTSNQTTSLSNALQFTVCP